MAQISTGYGWDAKDTYLIQLALAHMADLTEFGGDDFPVIPGCTTGAEVKAVGVIRGVQIPTDPYPVREVIAPYGDSTVIFGYVDTGTKYVLYAVSPTQSSNNIAFTDYRWPDQSLPLSQYGTGIYDSVSGFYYNSNGSGIGYNATSFLTPGIAIFSSMRELMEAITVASTPFYKLNAGYAISTLASWASLAGDTITTPVLISSNRDAVIMSTDGSTEDENQLISVFLFEGIRFYMSFFNLRGKTFSNITVLNVDLTQAGAAQPEKVFNLLISSSYANVTVTDSPDPYGGDSTEEGGDGEEIDDEPVLDDTHAIPGGAGFYHIFTPSLTQLRSLSNYIWGTLDVDNVKRIFSSPIESILGLGVVPISLTGTSTPVYIGGIDTQLSFPQVDDEIYDFNMGYVDIKKSSGSYLDYSPYTKISVYLPFIGFRELNVDDIMGEKLTLHYRIDIATGACIARLSVMGTTLYQFSGSCIKQLPITGTNWDNAITGAVRSAVTLGAAILGGPSAPTLAGVAASSTTQALMSKSSVDRSGALSGSSALMGGIIPYIVRTTPKLVIPTDQNKFIGYPSYITKTLGNLTGYNEISSIHLVNIPATDNELAEIESLLKGGVIL